MDAETINARVCSTFLGRDDHGIPTASIVLEWARGVQSFGGYNLLHPDRADFCHCVLDAVGVDSWEELPGTIARIRQTFRAVLAIGHAVEDRWYDPEGPDER